MPNLLRMDVTEDKMAMRARYGENKRIVNGDYDESCAVKCVNGTFVGKRADGVVAYKGIPFVGEQPVGEYRWKAPVDFTADDGVYEAYYNGKAPRQLENGGEKASLYVQGEDCLYLNIWKADDAGTEKKPVMVWIHGGAFEMGGTVDSLYEGTNFVRENKDVILVSIEYRVGVFGFIHLSHLPDGADYPDAQNLGIMDQLQALKWVHENIAGFGGDPDNVTIFGESAGGGSVSLLPLVEGSHAYFKRVIAQSGSPSLCDSTEGCIATTNKVLDALGCKTVAELQKHDVDELNEVAFENRMMRTAPERDGKLIPQNTYEAYANGAAKDIDILIGCNKDEFNYFVFGFGLEFYTAWGKQRKAEKLAQLSDEQKAKVESFCADVKGEEYELTSRLLDQYWFKAPVFRTCEEQVKGGGRAYAYYFTPESDVPLLRCAHAAELTTVFNCPEHSAGRVFDETFGKIMRKMWVQFAKTGDPSLPADVSPDGKAREWPLYDPQNKYVMVLDEFDVHVAKEADVKIVDWDRCYFLTDYYAL